MAREVTRRELCDDSKAILTAVDAGGSFIVTRNGDPVAELVPVRRKQFVQVARVVERFRDSPHIDYDRFRADLDSYLDQTIAPRG